MAKNPRVNEGDWICSDSSCSNVNFSWRDKCNKCGRDKGKVDTFKKTGAEIGKQAASKSGGLFSAEDWQCAMCGNVNWARRNECNVCKQPRFAKIEARTGIGGGYCERDNVEYIERQDSDDEIDEFGRKKKQFRLNKNKNGSSTDNNNEESDDDDDDDDVDLSKYDLVASDEENETKEEEKFSIKNDSKLSTNDHKSTENRHKRSRSPDQRRRSRSPDDRYLRDRRRSGSGERRYRHDDERRERRRSRERRRRSYRSRS